MKRVFLSALLITPILLGIPQIALAKAPTVKLTIEGGGLTKQFEITDPRILELSHVWGGNFLDHSREPAKDPPRGLPGYDVSFYVRFKEDGIRKKYVVRYYPNSSAEQGYIYLPGKGEDGHALNLESIVRSGRDGKWNYAAPAWERLIKPLIVAAKCADQRPE